MSSSAAFVSLGIREAMNDFRITGVPAAGSGSGVSRKAQWVIRELGLPAIVKACVSCRFYASPCHRKVPREREWQGHRRLDADPLRAVRTYRENPGSRARLCAGTRARSAADARGQRPVYGARPGHGPVAGCPGGLPVRLDRHMEAGNRHAAGERGREDQGPLEVIVRFRLPAPIRVEKLLMTGFGLSRSVVRDMVASGRIRLPMAIDAKAREDFAFFVNATAPPSRDAAVADRRAVRRRGALCVYTRRAR